MPRKNGKSTLAAALALLLLFLDYEPGAEVYSAAADKEQARIVFKTAMTMRDQEPELSSRSEQFKNSLVRQETQGSYVVLSREAFTKHGLNPHGVVVDEVHAHTTPHLIEALKTGVGARRQPMEIYITTSGSDRNSICYEMHDYAENVIEGVFEDPTLLAYIFAAHPEDDWTKEATWKKANPNYGVSVKKEYFEQFVREAKRKPRLVNTFKRLHLDIWTEQVTRWLNMERWDKCLDKEPPDLRGRKCFAGVDLASVSDLAAIGLVFPPVDDDPYTRILTWYFVPEETVAVRTDAKKVPYQVWADQGWIVPTEGNVTDYNVIRAAMSGPEAFPEEERDGVERQLRRYKLPDEGLTGLYDIHEIAIDRWNSQQISTQWTGDGFEMVPFGQGYASMSGPSKSLERLIEGKTLRHDGNPVTRWNARNVAIRTDAAENIKPDKEKSAEKIDGIVAIIMGIGRMDVWLKDEGSVYDKRGLNVA